MCAHVVAGGRQTMVLCCTPVMVTRFHELGGFTANRSGLNLQEIAEHHLLYLLCSLDVIVVDAGFVKRQAEILAEAYTQSSLEYLQALLEGALVQIEPM